MRPPDAALAPIPHDLPLELPLGREVILVGLVVTFVAHILFVNLMVGGSLLTFAFELLGWHKRRPEFDRLAFEICRTITVNKSLAVVLGVGPPLLMNLAYTVHFYSANSLTGIAWIMVVPTVTLAFCLTYLQKFAWGLMSKGLHLLVGGAAASLFLAIPLIFLTNINLMLYPEKWSLIRGFFSALFLQNIWPRYLHFLLASLAATSLFLAWKVRAGSLLESSFTASDLLRLFLRMVWFATLAQLGAGPLLYFTLPAHGVSSFLNLLLLLAVGLVLLLLSCLRQEVQAPEATIGKGLLTITVLFGVVVSLMATVRHTFREEALAWHRLEMAGKTREFQAASLAARRTVKENAAKQTPQQLFESRCAACHQPQGTGLPGVFPPLAGSEWVTASDPAAMISIVLDGAQGPLRVAGKTYNGQMPSHRDVLNNEQLAELFTYIRSAWGNQASPVTPEQVAARRSGSRSPWSESELLKKFKL